MELSWTDKEHLAEGEQVTQSSMLHLEGVLPHCCFVCGDL